MFIWYVWKIVHSYFKEEQKSKVYFFTKLHHYILHIISLNTFYLRSPNYFSKFLYKVLLINYGRRSFTSGSFTRLLTSAFLNSLYMFIHVCSQFCTENCALYFATVSHGLFWKYRVVIGPRPYDSQKDKLPVLNYSENGPAKYCLYDE